MNGFAKFLSINGLKRKDIASFLGVSGAFITQISSGDRPLPEDKLAMILSNAYGWDTSMLTQESSRGRAINLIDTSGLLRGTQMKKENLRSVVEEVLNPNETTLVSYLERKVSDQDILIRELYQQIGMLEAKLDLARKGEIAGTAEGSSSADAI